MELTVLRQYKDKATPGMMLINGAYYCHTLELPKLDCIPEGTYQVHLTFSPRFQRVMPLLISVPHADGVRIHWGNFVKDTKKCILVGYDAGKDGNGVEAVFRSKACFNEFFNWLQEANKTQKISIEIKEDKSGY